MKAKEYIWHENSNKPIALWLVLAIIGGVVSIVLGFNYTMKLQEDLAAEKEKSASYAIAVERAYELDQERDAAIESIQRSISDTKVKQKRRKYGEKFDICYGFGCID